MAQLTDKAQKLFEAPNLLFVATVNQDGSPQVTPVWTHVQDGYVTFNTAKGRVKERNMRRDPRVGLSIAARDNRTLTLSAEAGAAEVDAFEVWDLRSAWGR